MKNKDGKTLCALIAANQPNLKVLLENMFMIITRTWMWILFSFLFFKRTTVSGNFSCVHCGKVMSNKYNLKIHIRDIHETPAEQQEWICEYCNQRKKTQTALRIHTAKCSQHNPRNTYYWLKCLSKVDVMTWFVPFLGPNSRVCPTCFKSYSNQTNLNIHMRTVHENQDKTAVNCEHCGKSFKNDYSLRNHVYKYHRENKMF